MTDNEEVGHLMQRQETVLLKHLNNQPASTKPPEMLTNMTPSVPNVNLIDGTTKSKQPTLRHVYKPTQKKLTMSTPGSVAVKEIFKSSSENGRGWDTMQKNIFQNRDREYPYIWRCSSKQCFMS